MAVPPARAETDPYPFTSGKREGSQASIEMREKEDHKNRGGG